jgi:hypothetical protein
LKESITFTTLKNRLTILIIVLGFSVAAVAQQVKIAPLQDNAVKVSKFYPNPATSSINFEFTKGSDKSYTLQLFNFMGRKVYEVNPGSQRIFVPLDGFFRGVYIYQIRNKFGKITDSGRFQVIK